MKHDTPNSSRVCARCGDFEREVTGLKCYYGGVNIDGLRHKWEELKI